MFRGEIGDRGDDRVLRSVHRELTRELAFPIIPIIPCGSQYGFKRDAMTMVPAQLEAVSEEEGADAVRLLTIHGAKGLEFKVVVVADAQHARLVPLAWDLGAAFVHTSPLRDALAAVVAGLFGVAFVVEAE